ncbi:MAG: Nramp family divalent metal transporter [Candidatus Eisenbacteria bacterium]|nr:Nramp family divalent metal transporter [Candidatus Eisenbacteria bacterium]
MGPGIITANVDNDAGGITTYSLAGAHFGYLLLWTFLPMTVALIVIQEMCARMGVVTGKGLADLIREQFGVRLSFVVMLLLLAANLGNIMAEFAGIASALEIFGISRYIAIPLIAFGVWRLVVKGTYRIVEKVFLFACLIYISYIISGIMAHPPWGEVLKRAVVPTLRWDPAFLSMTIGVVGTTIAPWMQFYQQAAVVDKGISVDQYHASRMDTIVGMVSAVVVVFFITISCAATLNVHGVRIRDAADAARALEPLAGVYAGKLFAIGLLNASIFAASILPLSTAYSVCESFGWETGVDRRFMEAPQFFGLYTFLIAVGAGVILLPRFPLLKVMFFSQVANGMLLPVILVFMLKLINDRGLMGDYVNSRFFNVVAGVTTVVMVALTLALVASQIFGWGA